MYAAKSRANTINTHIALVNAEKGNNTMGEYIAALKTLGNNMMAAGKPLDAEDMVAYTLASLDYHYDGLVDTIGARVEPITVSDLYFQIMIFERHQVLC